MRISTVRVASNPVRETHSVPAESTVMTRPVHVRQPPGRKSLPPEEKTKPRSVRLKDAQWEKLKRLGSHWLVEQIDKAKEPRAPV